MVAALLVLPTALAAGPQPSEFRNADPTAFGTIDMPTYTDAPAGEPTDFAVPLTLHPEALTRPAARYLVGFDLHDTAVRMETVLLTLDGAAVPIERDERGDALQPRVIIAGDALPRDGPAELVLSGRAVAGQDGQVHVGVLAIAFDAGWGTLRTKDGEPAQAYGFTLLQSTGHATAGLAPRFHGQGNSALALAPLALLAAVTVSGLRTAHRRLHPAPPKPARKPAPAQVAPVPPAPSPALVEFPPRHTVVARPQPAVVARPPRPAPRHLQPRPIDGDNAFVVVGQRSR